MGQTGFISSVSVIASCGTIEVVEGELLNTINNIITEGLSWNLPTISRSLVRYTLSFAVELCNFSHKYETKPLYSTISAAPGMRMANNCSLF